MIYASRTVDTGSDKGLSSIRHQAIIGTNAGFQINGPLRTHVSEIWIRLQPFSHNDDVFENVVCKMAAISMCYANI